MARKTTSECQEEWQLIHQFDDNGKPFKMATGIAQCPNRDFVIVDPVEIRVGIFTAEGIFRINLNPDDDNDQGKLFQPSDVAVTSDGLIVVVDKSPDVKVFKLDSGLFAYSFKTAGVDDSRSGTGDITTHVCPAAVRANRATENTEYIYILDILRKLITCHEKDGALVQSIPTGGAPYYLSVINSHRFLLSDYNHHKLRMIDTSSGIAKVILVIDTPIDGLGRRANAVGACVNDESILVALGRRQGHCTIHRYSSVTGRFVGIVATKLTNPFNMVMTAEGKLAVADGGKVKIFERLSTR